MMIFIVFVCYLYYDDFLYVSKHTLLVQPLTLEW